MGVSPWVIVGAAGVSALAIAAYRNRHLEDESAPRVARLESGGRSTAAAARELDRIDAKKAGLDARFARARSARKEAEKRAATWASRAATGHRGARDKATAAAARATRYRALEESISTTQDQLEARYQAIQAGRARNPADPELAAAMAASERFHGTPNEVIELDPAERHVSKYLVVLGRQPELDYEPDKHSERSGYIWDHAIGDRGDFVPKGPGQAILAWDLAHRRPVTVLVDSAMDFDPARGLIG